jgi:hypothetical protein
MELTLMVDKGFGLPASDFGLQARGRCHAHAQAVMNCDIAGLQPHV